MPRPALRFDVFCRVVDNLGDAGVALRLSRQLATEHAAEVTLWIDDVRALSPSLGGIAVADGSCHDHVSIRTLASMGDDVRSAQVVVETFGCGLPDRYLDAMERAPQVPVWIVLEYLSAESWVGGTNALPSPHPSRPLRRWFLFPGFTPDTAGLLRERHLLDARRQSEACAGARAKPWIALRFPPPDEGSLAVSLFCYPGVSIAALLDAWIRGDDAVWCLVAEGVATREIAAVFGRPVDRDQMASRGALTLAVAPFVHQHAFDRRLWSSDLCIVRGEDSFVRAQWAAKPFAWHIYPQSERAHHAKLAAFLARYEQGLDPSTARSLRDFWVSLNESDADAVVRAWRPFREALPLLETHAQAWADRLASQRDQATQLVGFASERL